MVLPSIKVLTALTFVWIVENLAVVPESATLLPVFFCLFYDNKNWTFSEVHCHSAASLLPWVWSGDQVSAKYMGNLQNTSSRGRETVFFVTSFFQLQMCDDWSFGSHVEPWGRSLLIRVEIESWVLITWWSQHTDPGPSTSGFLSSKKIISLKLLLF